MRHRNDSTGHRFQSVRIAASPRSHSLLHTQGYGEFRHLVIPHLLPHHRILVLGCGNSSLSVELWGDGFKHVTSVDLSPVVIQNMRERSEAAGMPELQWQAWPVPPIIIIDGFTFPLSEGTCHCFPYRCQNTFPPPALVEGV